MMKFYKSNNLFFCHFIIMIITGSLIIARPCLGKVETRGQLFSSARNKINKTIQHDLTSILAPVDKINVYTFRQLGGVGIPTTPYGTEVRGLCRMDQIVLKYATKGNSLKGHDLQIQPYGVEARALFHVTQIPVTALPDDQIQNAVWRDDCYQLRGLKSISWFSARDELRAAEAVNFVIQVKADIEGGTLTPNCVGYLARQAGCLTPNKISAYDIGDVKQCSDQYGILCLVITTNAGLILTVTATLSTRSLNPDRILSISVDQEVVVTSN